MDLLGGFFVQQLFGLERICRGSKDQNFSVLQIFSFLIAGLMLYRAVIFVHELTHLKKDTFRFFHVVWNFICGYPLMLPSMLYQGVHIDHHKQKLYGTQER